MSDERPINEPTTLEGDTPEERLARLEAELQATIENVVPATRVATDVAGVAVGGAVAQEAPPPPRPEFTYTPPQLGGRDADFSRAVLEDIYRYPKKRRLIAFTLWATLGWFGAHRVYLGRTLSALPMMFTLGGFLIWWIVDGFLISGMVRKFNEEQEARKADGRPPHALSFMPRLDSLDLPPVPIWAEKRGGRARLGGDVLVLVVAGLGLGSLVGVTGNFEPILAIVALIAITLMGARWDALAHMPVLRAFDRWNHRLRLYYYVNDPGGPLALFFRPFTLFGSWLRKKRRAEARLYLQLGITFTAIFTVIDIIQAGGSGTGPFGINPGLLLVDFVQTFFIISLFATPIGAILTTHLLLEKTDKLIWVMSAVALGAITVGALAV